MKSFRTSQKGQTAIGGALAAAVVLGLLALFNAQRSGQTAKRNETASLGRLAHEANRSALTLVSSIAWNPTLAPCGEFATNLGALTQAGRPWSWTPKAGSTPMRVTVNSCVAAPGKSGDFATLFGTGASANPDGCGNVPGLSTVVELPEKDPATGMFTLRATTTVPDPGGGAGTPVSDGALFRGTTGGSTANRTFTNLYAQRCTKYQLDQGCNGTAPLDITQWGSYHLQAGDRIRFVSAVGRSFWRVHATGDQFSVCPQNWRIHFELPGGVLVPANPGVNVDTITGANAAVVPAGMNKVWLGYHDNLPINYFDNEALRTPPSVPGWPASTNGCSIELEVTSETCP